MDASALAVKVRVLLCTDESHIDMHACICAGRASASAPIAPAYAKLRAAIRAAEAVRSFLHPSTCCSANLDDSNMVRAHTP